MAYVGRRPLIGNYIVLDAITASATTTFNLTQSGSAYSPQLAQNCIVSVNGVIQAPNTSYTISGSTIVFSTALATTDTINFITVLGDVLNVGTPSAGTVNAASFATGFNGVVTWQNVQTTNFTAVAGRGYPVNTTLAGITMTLPASATTGATIQVVDYSGTFGTNNLTVNPNGLKINSGTGNKILNTNREAVTLTYIDSTQGWLLSSDAQITLPNAPYSIDFLVVAGGASAASSRGGGGGGGGMRTSTQSVTGGTVITVTVGDGGAAIVPPTRTRGNNGSDSSISGSGLTTITSSGGGGGGDDQSAPSGKNGGSGGGGLSGGSAGLGNTPSTSPSQGANGGTGAGAPFYGAGGGGGGGSSGVTGGNGASNGTAGNGGDGTTSSITGTSIYYAGGGGGGYFTSGTGGSGGLGGGGAGAVGGTAGASGTANTGGGGGGAKSIDNEYAGGAGGKGVVILSVPTANYSGTSTGSPTITTSGSNTILQFNGSGSYTA